METLAGVLVTAILALPLGLAAAGWRGGGGRYVRAAECGAGGVAVCAAGLGLAVAAGGPLDLTAFTLSVAGVAVRVGPYVDALSAVMAALTATVGFVVVRYSARYLDGNPGQGRFLAWVLFTLFAVLALVCCRNLALFVLAWAAVSFGLHQLLVFNGDRPAALRAARKKFVISRLGDVCLVGALALAYRAFGTFEFPELFRLAAEAPAGWEGQAMAVLLVVGAMTKSAQFPFHTWLPETMETPTPVSALMHAGVINAGGYLVVRLSPLVAQSPLALDLLLVVGAVTAALGGLIMLTQTDVKRSLAYSTVSQMGFMMMQCGLGAFSAAVLHIVAHGLYKAHAFLASGEAARRSKPAADLPVGKAALYGGVSLALSVGLVAAGQWLTGADLLHEPGGVVLEGFLVAGAAVLLFGAAGGMAERAAMAGVGAAVVLGYLLAWKAFDAALGPFLALASVEAPSPFAVGFSALLVVMTAAALLGVFFWPAVARSALAGRLYVHVLNGFYIADLVRAPFAARGLS